MSLTNALVATTKYLILILWTCLFRLLKISIGRTSLSPSMLSFLISATGMMIIISLLWRPGRTSKPKRLPVPRQCSQTHKYQGLANVANATAESKDSEYVASASVAHENLKYRIVLCSLYLLRCIVQSGEPTSPALEERRVKNQSTQVLMDAKVRKKALQSFIIAFLLLHRIVISKPLDDLQTAGNQKRARTVSQANEKQEIPIQMPQQSSNHQSSQMKTHNPAQKSSQEEAQKPIHDSAQKAIHQPSENGIQVPPQDQNRESTHEKTLTQSHLSVQEQAQHSTLEPVQKPPQNSTHSPHTQNSTWGQSPKPAQNQAQITNHKTNQSPSQWHIEKPAQIQESTARPFNPNISRHTSPIHSKSSLDFKPPQKNVSLPPKVNNPNVQQFHAPSYTPYNNSHPCQTSFYPVYNHYWYYNQALSHTSYNPYLCYYHSPYNPTSHWYQASDHPPSTSLNPALAPQPAPVNRANSPAKAPASGNRANSPAKAPLQIKTINGRFDLRTEEGQLNWNKMIAERDKRVWGAEVPKCLVTTNHRAAKVAKAAEAASLLENVSSLKKLEPENIHNVSENIQEHDLIQNLTRDEFLERLGESFLHSHNHSCLHNKCLGFC